MLGELEGWSVMAARGTSCIFNSSEGSLLMAGRTISHLPLDFLPYSTPSLDGGIKLIPSWAAHVPESGEGKSSLLALTMSSLSTQTRLMELQQTNPISIIHVRLHFSCNFCSANYQFPSSRLFYLLSSFPSLPFPNAHFASSLILPPHCWDKTKSSWIFAGTLSFGHQIQNLQASFPFLPHFIIHLLLQCTYNLLQSLPKTCLGVLLQTYSYHNTKKG